MNFTAFFSYVFLTAFTPGPNNIISMTNAGRCGFRGAIPYASGVFVGVVALCACGAAFSSLLFSLSSAARPAMLCLGAAYLLWLAWNLWRDRPGSGRSTLSRTDTFASGVFMQFVNVKMILYCVTTLSSFVLPHYRDPAHLAGFAALLAGTALASNLSWALFGSVFERFFKKYGRAFNACMALLLAWCAAAMLMDLRQ